MKAYKYMTAEGGLRFLKNWSLRITPSEDFNDPFELKPEAEEIISTSDFIKDFPKEEFDDRIVRELKEGITNNFHLILTACEIDTFVKYIINPPKSSEQNLFTRKISQKIPNFSEKLKNAQNAFASYPMKIKEHAPQVISKANSRFKYELTNGLFQKNLGILCLTRNRNQPLMWSHYADSHKGVVFEFNVEHSAFNKNNPNPKILGKLHNAIYSMHRPSMKMEEFSKGDLYFIEKLALTKSMHWSYEEELRMLWPIEWADSYAGANKEIALISCPSSAVLSITLGCKSSDKTLQEIKDLLRSQPNTEHIKIQKAKLHDTDFALEYYPV